MNRVFLYLSLILCAILAPISAYPQELTGEQLTALFQRNTSILYDCIMLMSDKSKPLDVRDYYVKRALNLFVNQGESFPLDSVVKPGAKITVKSKYRSKPVQRLAKDYFTGLKELRYPTPEISALKFPSFPNRIDLSTAKQINNNLYMVKIPITREFVGYIDGTPVYKDITHYDYTLFYTIENSIDGKEFLIFFHDIEIPESNDKKNEK